MCRSANPSHCSHSVTIPHEGAGRGRGRGRERGESVHDYHAGPDPCTPGQGLDRTLLAGGWSEGVGGG